MYHLLLLHSFLFVLTANFRVISAPPRILVENTIDRFAYNAIYNSMLPSFVHSYTNRQYANCVSFLLDAKHRWLINKSREFRFTISHPTDFQLQLVLPVQHGLPTRLNLTYEKLFEVHWNVKCLCVLWTILPVSAFFVEYISQRTFYVCLFVRTSAPHFQPSATSQLCTDNAI